MYQRLSKRVIGSREEGFTLIELLIVIVILGILAGIVVFAVGSARSDSVSSACKADAKTVSTAAEAGKAKTGSYPAQGALPLKSYPTSTNYSITYDQTAGTGTCVIP